MKQGLGIIPAKQANRQLVMRLPGCGTILQAALFRSLPRMASQKWPIWLSILRPTFPARPAGPMTISLHPSVTAFQVLRVGLTTIFSPPSVILPQTLPAGPMTISLHLWVILLPVLPLGHTITSLHRSDILSPTLPAGRITT